MHRSARLVFALTLLAATLGGCAAINPYRLEDQVAMFHDDLRWNRLPAAELSVDSDIRTQFERHHEGWGRVVHIVDVEIENTRVNQFVGTARARFIWTRGRDTDIRETEVETRWHAKMDGNWVCDDERVVGGDPMLMPDRNGHAGEPSHDREVVLSSGGDGG